MTRNRYLEEDFERESLKDSVYLHEKRMEEEEEYYSSIREPAKIIVIHSKQEENVKPIKELQL